MNTYHYRYLYQNTDRGTIHTASAELKKNGFCLCYMCSDGRPLRERGAAEERFKNFGERISVLVLEKLHEEDMQEAARILREHQVERVFLPYGDKAEDMPELMLADRIHVMKAGEEISFCEKGWQVWLKCMPEETQGTLVLYHGPSEETKENQDCIMTAKPFHKELPCQVCVEEGDRCGMRCSLYNDYTLCKGHNARDVDGYVTGALLLGNVDLNQYGCELQENLMQYREDIRMVTLPGQGMKEKNSELFLDYLNEVNDNLNRYYVLPEGTYDNEKVLKDVLKKGPRQVTVLTTADKGFCMSGFFTDKQYIS